MWLDSIAKIRSSNLPVTVDVIGEFNAYLVYSNQHAVVKMQIEPAQNLEVVTNDTVIEKIQYAEYIDSAIFGLLDVLAFSGPLAYFNVRIVVKDADCDRINFSPMAFRFAGRDAGRKVLQHVRESSVAARKAP